MLREADDTEFERCTWKAKYHTQEAIVDLAISTKESAVYTVVVTGEVAWPNGKLAIYIQPNPIIRHMNFANTMATLDDVRHANLMSSEFYVEAVAYRQAAIKGLERSASRRCIPSRTSVCGSASRRGTSRTAR